MIVSTPLVKAVLTLLEVATEAERKEIVGRVQQLGLPLSNRAGEVLRLASSQFSPGRQMSVSSVMAACQAEKPGTTRKEVYNALGYLTRRGKIRRVRQGRYEAASSLEGAL